MPGHGKPNDIVCLTRLINHPFHLRRADFPITLYRNPTRQLYIHIVRLLNRRHAAGVLTRLIKVKAHCGEPLNEAADALASAAAEADGAPMSGEQHLDPCAVQMIYCRQAALRRATKLLMPTPQGRRPLPIPSGREGLIYDIRWGCEIP